MKGRVQTLQPSGDETRCVWVGGWGVGGEGVELAALLHRARLSSYGCTSKRYSYQSLFRNR